jgi:hypothetical protein
MRQIKERVAIKLVPKLHEPDTDSNYVLFWLVEFLTRLQSELWRQMRIHFAFYTSCFIFSKKLSHSARIVYINLDILLYSSL